MKSNKKRSRPIMPKHILLSEIAKRTKSKQRVIIKLPGGIKRSVTRDVADKMNGINKELNRINKLGKENKKKK